MKRINSEFTQQVLNIDPANFIARIRRNWLVHGLAFGLSTKLENKVYKQ